MAIINNVPGRTIRQSIDEQWKIQHNQPWPGCNICDVPGLSAKEQIKQMSSLPTPNRVPGDTVEFQNSQKPQSFMNKVKNFFKH